MKYLISIALLFVCLTVQAQEPLAPMREYVPHHKQTFIQKWDRPVGIILYHIGTVALGSIGDAMMDEGNKNLGHFLQAAEIGSVLSGPFIFKVKRHEALSYISSYCFLRFSFFDSFYAKSRGLPLLYNGTTSGYDRFMNTIPPDGRVWMKSWSFIVGISVPLKHIY